MQIGTYGELDFISYFSNRYEIEDVRLNEEYWARDIDFILTSKETGAARTVEVKTDNRIFQTGNLFIETENPRSANGLGWFNFCEADIVCYYDFVQKIFHFFTMEELRKYVEEEKDSILKRCTWDMSVGMVIPLSEVEKFESYKRVYVYGREVA